MHRARIAALVLATLALTGAVRAVYEDAAPGAELGKAAVGFVGTLTSDQRDVAVLPYDTPKRVDWHFIPKAERKGLQFKLMTKEQQQAALKLLRSALSQIGYDKATKIMSLENLLRELEAGKGQNIRDPERYFFTLFGKPGDGRWGLSFEGHHLCLNFVVEGDRVISSTPQVFCTNPAIVKTENKSGIAVGTRVLEEEETLAFELVNGLNDGQKTKAIFAEKAIKEVRAAGVPQPPTDPAVGIAMSALEAPQKKLLRRLIEVYCSAMPNRVAAERIDDIEKAGWENVTFGWAGATKPGIGHYYRIQGPTFLVEFVNTQPDAAGNIANHIHAVWRDMRGDFALPVK
ncbi:hypothetical protein Pan44_37990 [Caulifigura coniformis]|uniref:DUF3500 domain-containing protein n=1 Tax=Caulifigura coniformis TaxID=2527983 RepID=A0A517SI04_9PLAN|nr:DUF3500 domain-containing protein [Caulifigura coniformis]QDT55752.1 hypothetical protein Pan44_37990 [Caulifigura coniformis]